MSTDVMSIRLPEELKGRLDALSASTGRPAAFYVREALSEHLAELEYAYALRAEAEAARRGELETFGLDEVMADFEMTQDEPAGADFDETGADGA
jgi:RHH-type rel operon transcriptional repressor/antitoxin RelB